MVCVYLCSNLEIAEQNRDKLTDEKTEPATRLTLITLRAKAIDEARNNKKVAALLIYARNISLKLGGTTGIKSERLLLLAGL